jgi:hypothetical protein
VAEYSLLPGPLALKSRRGDEFSATVVLAEGTAAFSIAGYTVTAGITSLVDGRPVGQFTVTVPAATAGVVAFSLQELETLALPSGSYGWSLRWVAPGSVARTALAGVLEVTR